MSSRRTTVDFRRFTAEAAALRLGREVFSPREPRVPLSEVFNVPQAPQQDPGALQGAGVSGWAVAVGTRGERLTSALLDDAVARAQADEVAVAIEWRRGRAMSDQYATMRFADWLDVVEALADLRERRS